MRIHYWQNPIEGPLLVKSHRGANIGKINCEIIISKNQQRDHYWQKPTGGPLLAKKGSLLEKSHRGAIFCKTNWGAIISKNQLSNSNWQKPIERVSLAKLIEGKNQLWDDYWPNQIGGPLLAKNHRAAIIARNQLRDNDRQKPIKGPTKTDWGTIIDVKQHKRMQKKYNIDIFPFSYGISWSSSSSNHADSMESLEPFSPSTLITHPFKKILLTVSSVCTELI